MKRALFFITLIALVTVFFRSGEERVVETAAEEDVPEKSRMRKSIPGTNSGSVVHSYAKNAGRFPASLIEETSLEEVSDPEPAVVEERSDERVPAYANVPLPLSEEEAEKPEPGMGLYGPDSERDDEAPASASPKSSSPSRNVASFVGGGRPVSSQPVTPEPVSSNPDSGSPTAPLSTGSCTSSHASGTYEAPIDVTLDCTSTVRYCLQANTCCDPEASGTIYTGLIPVGTEVGDYCLSFTDGANASELMFSFVPDVPDLSVTAAKTYFQATELPHSSWNIESSFFGDEKYALSQVNYLSSDPTAMSCEDIVNDSTPRETIASFTLGTETSGVPYEKTIGETDLDYGTNYLTTIVRNVSWADISTCDHQVLVLEDFEYFEEYASHSSSDFAGTFHPYASTDENLHTGLLSVFYEESL